ncbi:MAG: hypothetical protein DRI46_10195 [Chloroflexi bacterium]|nr:MAG: hypothetical protein DRI46_10195 [Chloroflexota bacterium]
MDYEQAVKEVDRQMQESVKRVEEQMKAAQVQMQKVVSDSIAKMDQLHNPQAKEPEPKSELVTTDSGEQMLVLNLDAVAVLKNVFALMQEVVNELK